MPPKKVGSGTAPLKPRYDCSPGNPDGYRALKDWGTKETQVAVEVITRLVLDNRAAFRAEPALHPWSYNTGDPINQKLRQLLTKLCKDHEVDFSSVAATRSPQKRAAGSPDDGEDKKPLASPKKAKPSPAKRAVKKEAPALVSTDHNGGTFTDSEETDFTPSPSSTPKKKVSGSPPVKKGTELPNTPEKLKEEPVTPIKSVEQEKKIAKDVKDPSPTPEGNPEDNPEDKMDVDVEDEGEDEPEGPIKQTRRKKKVIADDYSPSRSATPCPAAALSSEVASSLNLSPNRPKRGCARQTNYNLALKFDGLDEYLKEKEESAFEEESEEEEEHSEDGDEEEKAGGDDAETEDEGDENATDEEDEK
jgi:hypothetical protein